MHTRMAVMRAVENGVSLVRQTRSGLSGAYDYTGRPLAAMDAFLAFDQALVAQVPVHGVRTVYASVGDVFAWADLAAWVGLAVWAVRRHASLSLHGRPEHARSAD
jgi:apolipoprotein N-acyltransferase